MTDTFKTLAQETDQPVTAEAEVLQLSLADQIQFTKVILSPPEPSEALIRAFELRKKLIR